MAVANLLGKLKNNPGGLDGLVLFGRVRCTIKTPDMLKGLGTAGNGVYAILDTFALKCMKDDHFYSRTDRNLDKVYYTKGSIVFFLNKPELVGKYCKVGGKAMAYGVKVKQQRGHKQPYDGVTAFVFSKGNNDEWVVNPNSIVELGEKDSDLRSPDMWDFVLKHIAEQSEIVEYPIALDGIIQYEGIEEYEELGSEQLEGVGVNFHRNNGEKINLSKIDLKLTHHLSAMNMPSFFYDVEDEIEEQSRKRQDYTRELGKIVVDEYAIKYREVEEVARRIKESFVTNVACKFSENVGRSKIKGRYYIDQLLNCLSQNAIGKADSDSEESSRCSDKEIEKLKEKILEDPYVLMTSDIENDRLEDPFSFASMVIGFSTGVGYDGLTRNFNALQRVVTVDFRAWFCTLLIDPYLLSMMGSSISVVDADVIYYSYTKYFANSLKMDNCLEVRKDLLYLKAIEESCESSGNSMVSKGQLYKIQQTGSYGGSRLLKSNNFPLKVDLVALLTVICGLSALALSPREKGEVLGAKWYESTRTQSLMDRGLIDEVEDKLMLEKDLEKEALIFKVFQQMGMQETGITDEMCEAAIEKFENKVGFKLESLQRDGIKLTKYRAAVLSGCAGSGKTTTSDCMTICLEDNLEGYKMVYATPTGKASRRLAEVVEGTVKTVHSEFKVGVGVGESYLLRIKKKKPTKAELEERMEIRGKIYLVDEAGMLNRDLLYEIARSIKDGDMIYFLGDIKQLPPIGIGVPFYILMQILPCVELGVSKRAAEGSLVNYNTTLINCLSDGMVEELMFDDSTFMRIECNDIDLPNKCVKLWKDFMEGTVDGKSWAEKDVQIITGYATDKCDFSSTNLNPKIQSVLRNKDKMLFRHGTRDFYKNDRVIHANSNLYGTPRFVEISKGVYQEVATIGLINGEMGTLIGCADSRTIELKELPDSPKDLVAGEGLYSNVTEEGLAEILKTREDYKDRLISMSEFVDEYTWFAIVKVYDVNLKRDVIIFYDGRKFTQDGVLCLGGNALNNLELAYALTTHKMQGSQTPIAIIPIGSTANPSFINRNMLNTMITRSQGVVALLGTIDGDDSPLNKGRQIPSKYETESLLTILCKQGEKAK